MGYISRHLPIRAKDVFDDWFSSLSDVRTRARVQACIDRLEMGNSGDSKPVGGGIVELKIDRCPGHRIYYTQRGCVVVVLLCGGDKSTRPIDIRRAKALAKALDLE